MEIVHKKNTNWVVETYLDDALVSGLTKCVDGNLDKLYENTYSSAVQGKNSTQYWIYDYQEQPKFFNSEFDNLMGQLKTKVYDVLTRNKLIENNTLEYESVWTIVGEENSYCIIHDHTNIFGISAVLYLRVPEKNFNDNLTVNSGQIYFVLDSDNQEEFSSRVIHINPDIGKFLIFPNWILHGTYPQQKGIRQTLNTNLFIR